MDDYRWVLLVVGGIGIAFAVLIAWAVIAHDVAVRDCAAKGGTYVHTARHHSVCLEGVVLE